MRVHEHDYRRRFDRCRDQPYAAPLGDPDDSPMDRLATSVGDAVTRLIRAFDPADQPQALRRREPAGHRRGRTGRHDHRCDRGCGCEPSCCEPACCEPVCGPDPCHCTCCIGDVDLVVYARVGETRVVPVRIQNLRKRERQIELQLSEFTTKGGNPTPVAAQIVPPTTFELAPCSEHEALIVIKVGVPGAEPKPGRAERQDLADLSKAQLADEAREAGVRGVASMNKEQLIEAVATERPPVGTPDRPIRELRDVDDCHVAVADLRVQGCDTRPVRIAVAVLPRDCGAYDVRCDCGCC